MTGDVDALILFLFVSRRWPRRAGRRHHDGGAGLLDTGCGAGVRVGAAGGLRARALGLQRAARGPGAAAQESAAGSGAAVLDAVDGHADMVAACAGADPRAFRAPVRAERAGAPGPGLRRGARALVPAGAGARPCWVCCGSGWANTRAAACPGLCWRVCCWRSWAYSKWPRPSRGASRLGSAVSAAQHPRGGAMRAGHDPRRAGRAAGGWRAGTGRLALRYPDGALVLDGVSLRVAPGERVAIQGESGAGKSTLLHLILRLEDPQAGQVRYGGRDARDCAQADWHALLSQDAPVFLGTLRTNLLIGDPRRTKPRCARWMPRAWAISCAVCPTGWAAGRDRRCCRPGRRGGCAWRGPCCRRPGCWCWTNPPPARMRRPRPISCAIWGGRRGAPWCWPRMRSPAGAVDRRCAARGQLHDVSSPEPVLA